jgi:hypothetical protein
MRLLGTIEDHSKVLSDFQPPVHSQFYPQNDGFRSIKGSFLALFMSTYPH